ncbi:retrovirus-related pol polyprotein from transposon TNT 1-94 [Tanacetum coccineum]
MIIKKDSEIVKAKGEIKSIAFKAKIESSDECSTSRSDDEEYAIAVRDFKKFFKRRECPKPPKDKNQRAFARGCWSDSGEEDDEKAKDETYDLTLDNEYDKLCKMCLKIITKNKRLKAIRNSLNELSELKLKLSTLEKNKGVDLECTKCQFLRIENEKLKEEAIKLTKFEKSTHCLNEMLSNQKPSGDKLGLGFNSLEASTSGTKEIKFVKSQKETSPGRGPLNKSGPHIAKAAPKAIMRPPVCSPGQICYNKCRVTFSKHDSEITKDGKVIGRGIRKKGLYVMKLENKAEDKICLAMINENSTLWHRRLGHANMHLIQSLASKELVRNLPKLKFDQHFCDACKIGKQAYASHKAKNIVLTTRCLELLHMDLFGPSAVRSYGGNLYTLVIVYDYSSKCFILNAKDYCTKFDPKSYEGVFLGYSQNSNAYIVLNKHTMKIEESLNMMFDETPPPSKTSPLVDVDLDEEEAINVIEKKKN